MSFAFDEAVALYLGRRFLEPLAGTIFWDAAQQAFKKIREIREELRALLRLMESKGQRTAKPKRDRERPSRRGVPPRY